MHNPLRRALLPALFLSLLSLALAFEASRREAPRFYKGNTHTHTLWSDGDAPPDVVTAWYKEHGYHFLVLSDHDVLQQQERWFPISVAAGAGRLRPEHVEGMREAFGADQVTVRDTEAARELRLAKVSDLASRFGAPGEFLMIAGEEVSSAHRAEGAEDSTPVHVNAMNISEVIPRGSGDSPRAVMNDAVKLIRDHGRRVARPVLAHVNHPNFHWALTWEDLAHLKHDRFFEVFNGHRGVANYGDDEHLSTEAMWDRALFARLTTLELGLLYGVATDDAHNYRGRAVARTGRGWIQVRATSLDASALIAAMRAGDFYASSGVTLEDFGADKEKYWVDVDTEEGVTYTVRFIGTRQKDGPGGRRWGEPGEVLARTTADPAVYTYDGTELYVRAVVESSREHPDPFAGGDKEMAWVQPVMKRFLF